MGPTRISRGQDVDTLPSLEIAVGPDSFDHDDALLLASLRPDATQAADPSLLQTDPDLASLRADARFATVVRESQPHLSGARAAPE